MKKHNIVFLDSYTLNPGDIDMSALRELGELTLYDRTAADQVLDRCMNADIVISNKVKLSEEIITQLPKLRMIQVAATGMNNVPVDFVKSRNIHVDNVSGYSTSSVAQHVFAMILSYLNSPARYMKESSEKAWSGKEDFSYWHNPIVELKDKTLGVWGFGKIGQAVAKVGLAFEMRVVAVNKYADSFQMDQVDNVNTEQILAQSDFLSLHTPLNESTKEMINAQSLHQMKSSAVLINTGRGPLIREADLAEALQTSKIAAALLDVLSQEPPSSTNVLLGAKNSFITPHQAWASQESRERLLQGIVKNIQDFISN